MDVTIPSRYGTGDCFLELLTVVLDEEKRIDELSYKYLKRVWKNSFFLKMFTIIIQVLSGCR